MTGRDGIEAYESVCSNALRRGNVSGVSGCYVPHADLFSGCGRWGMVDLLLFGAYNSSCWDSSHPIWAA